jgi:hypothetical protein
MKTKLAIALLLAAVCLLLVTAGTGIGHAQPPQLTPQAYLPMILKPCPLYGSAAAYMTADRPIAKVGEIVTMTGALVNECGIMLSPGFELIPSPTGVLTPDFAVAGDLGYSDYILPGSYRTFTMTFRATTPGAVTLTGDGFYYTIIIPRQEILIGVPITSLTIRVVPN